MLEETLIRESANNKLQNRGLGNQKMGPPVTFANHLPPKTEAFRPMSMELTEETKSSSKESGDMLAEHSFDVVPSPQRRATVTSSRDVKPAKSAPMVPQEQYDALKQRFIENETAAQRRLESINDLEAKIQKREQQLVEMEQVFSRRLEESQATLDAFKQQAKEKKM